jgi:hypothetical protein
VTEPSTTDPATAAELRDLIDRDCPHRLPDFDGHLNGRTPTPAFIRLWRIEHAISSQPAIEQQITDLYEQIQNTDTKAEARPLFDQISRIRHGITEGLR